METVPPLRRRLTLWVVGLLFVLLTSMAAWRVMSVRDLAVERERKRTEQQLQSKVEIWEDELLGKLQSYLEEATSEQTAERMAALQRKYRKQRWFDSLFVWVPTRPEEPARIVFPLLSAPRSRQEIERSPCLHLLPTTPSGAVPLDDRVRLLVDACRNESATVRLHATTQAAYLLFGEHRYQEAWTVLEQARVSDTMRTAVERGVDPFRLAAWRTLRMKVLLQLGLPDAAATLAVMAGTQMADLDAPDLPAVLPHLRATIDLLEKQNRRPEGMKLGEAMKRAERRSHAYEEIHLRLKSAVPPPPGQTEPGRLVYDLYSDEPFVLYYGWANGLGAGLAIEQEPLVQDFLRDLPAEYRGAITISETRTEQWVGGARTGGRCAVVVPFDRTLTNVQVCLRDQWLRAYRASQNEQGYASLVIIAMCAMIGLGALLSLDRVVRHEFELLQRQRAFTTRVTHELKTPLAGIRVMAENLEVGAFRDEAHRQEMAHRIVAEADQLTKRVDEVLSAARERTIPRPALFDPEDVVLTAVDEWGPRLGDAGVALHAERILSTDPVLGDENALRDAISCLLDNALKYRREGRSDASVWLELEQIGRHVIIAVKDNGIGVPKAVRRKVFDRFYRVEGPHRGKAGGHGLGLHQVRQIVDAHHGTVTCGEGVGGGTQFTIRLPAAHPKRG